MSWKLYLYPPSWQITKDLKTKLSKSLNPECWLKVSLKPGDDPTPEASIEEAVTSSDLHINQANPFKAEGQGSSVAIKEDKEISSINSVAQAFAPKVEDREGHNLIPPTHLGGWLTSPSQ